MASCVTPGTWAAGTLASADLNSYVRDVARQLQGRSSNPKPFAVVYSSAAQTLTHDVFTQVTFDTTSVNRQSLFTSNSFVVPTGWAGLYSIKGGVNFDSPAGNKEVGIFVNGTQIAGENIYGIATAAFARKNICADEWLAAGDVITLKAFHDNPADINTLGTRLTRFSAFWVATDG